MDADATTPPPTTSAPATAPVAAPPAPPPSKEPAAKGGRGPTTPPAAAAPAEPPKLEKPKADEWARLTAQEKRHRKEAETLAAERRAFAEERKGIESQKERLALYDSAKAGDWTARQALMKETGLTYDELTKHVLAGGKVDKGETALQRVERLEAAIKERDEKDAASAQERGFRQDCENLTAYVTREKPDDHPILAGELETNRPWVEQVIKEMIDEAARTSRSLTVVECASLIEGHLRSETERRAARLRPAQPPPPPAVEAPKQSDDGTRPRDQTGRFAGVDGPRRLTNRDSAASAAPTPPTSTKRMTPRERDAAERERLSRAAAAMPRR